MTDRELVALMAAQMWNGGIDYREPIKHARELLAAIDKSEPAVIQTKQSHTHWLVKEAALMDAANEEITRLRARVAELEAEHHESADIILGMPTVDAGPLARIQHAELHRLLAPVLEAAGFSPAHEKAEDAIKRLLSQWRSGLEPRIPPSPLPSGEGVTVEEAFAVWSKAYVEANGPTSEDDRKTAIRAVLALCASRAGAAPRDDHAAIFSAIETEFTLIWEREHGPVVKSCPVARVILREAFKRIDDAARSRLTTAPGEARKEPAP